MPKKAAKHPGGMPKPLSGTPKRATGGAKPKRGKAPKAPFGKKPTGFGGY